MITLTTGETFEHDVYGTIEISGFRTVGDELELSEVETDEEETMLDPVMTVQDDKVEFIDATGSSYVEPLTKFYEHCLSE